MTTKTELLAFINEQESFWKPSSPVIKNVKEYLNMITNHHDLTGNELKHLLNYFSERLQKHYVNNLEDLKNFSDSGTLNTLKQLLEKFYPNMDLIYMYNNALLNDENWTLISNSSIKIKMAQWIIELYRDYGIDVSGKNAFSIVVKDEIVNYALKLAQFSSSNNDDVSALTILSTSVNSSRFFKENNISSCNKDIIIPIFFLHKNQCLTKKYFNFIQRLKRNANSNPNVLLFFAEWLVKFDLSDIVVTDEILFNIQAILSVKSGKYSSIFDGRENNCSLFSWMFKMNILSLKNLEALFTFPLQLNSFNLFMTETAKVIFAQESSSYDAQQMFDFMIENAANYHPERETSQSSKDMLDFKRAVFDGESPNFKLFELTKEDEHRIKILLECNNLTEKWLEENIFNGITCKNIKAFLNLKLTETEWRTGLEILSGLDRSEQNLATVTIGLMKFYRIPIASTDKYFLYQAFCVELSKIIAIESKAQKLVIFMIGNKILSKENIEILSARSSLTQKSFDFLSTKSVELFLSRTTADAQILFELMLELSQQSEFERKFERYLYADSVYEKCILEHCALQDIRIPDEERQEMAVQFKAEKVMLKDLSTKFSAFHEQFQARHAEAQSQTINQESGVPSLGTLSTFFTKKPVEKATADVVKKVSEGKTRPHNG